MLKGTQRSVVFSVNFILTPQVSLDQKRALKFQGALLDRHVEFDQVENVPQKACRLRSVREAPLEIHVVNIAPHLSQLSVSANEPRRALELFSEQAEMTCAAFREAWPEPQQVVARDAGLEQLYQARTPHAFQFLWEGRLKQSSGELKALGRPVLGGGLRFVMPPSVGKAAIELKIESLFRDPRSLYISTQFSWPLPCPIADGLKPKALLDEVKAYSENEVIRFILPDQQGEDTPP